MLDTAGAPDHSYFAPLCSIVCHPEVRGISPCNFMMIQSKMPPNVGMTNCE